MTHTPTPWKKIVSKKHPGALFFKEPGYNDNFICKFYAGHEDDARLMMDAIEWYKREGRWEEEAPEPTHVLHSSGVLECTNAPDHVELILNDDDTYTCQHCGTDLTKMREEAQRVNTAIEEATS